MTKEITQFKYEQLDDSTADFLRQKESNMRQIVGKAYTELGKELYEAQQRLAGSRYDGVFERWYTHLGWKRQTVYNLIDRFTELQKLEDGDTRERFEEIPVTLSYAISGKSAESTPTKSQAKSEVLAGEITTLKEYRERIKELERKAEQSEQQAEAERKERERLEQENEELLSREPEVRVETKTEYIEVRDEYSEKRAEEAERRLKEYEDKFGDIRNYDEQITATHRQDMIVAVMSLSKGVREFIRRYDYMSKYKDTIDNLDEESIKQYNGAIKALKAMADSFEYSSTMSEVIDVDYEDIK